MTLSVYAPARSDVHRRRNLAVAGASPSASTVHARAPTALPSAST